MQQPTAFDLSLHDINAIKESPDLSASVERFVQAEKHHFAANGPESQPSVPLNLQPSSSLLLRIVATADYFTTNQTLMQSGLLVDFDISESITKSQVAVH